MKADPYQMNNFLSHTSDDKQTEVFGFSIDQLVSRVDALLLTLKACEGEVCIRPWQTLHPTGNVKSLKDAMNSKYDEFYTEKQKKVTFTGCAQGYLPYLEGAMEPIPYKDEDGHVKRMVNWYDLA